MAPLGRLGADFEVC